MRGRILAFAEQLRVHGIEPSVAETMDAVAAVARAGVDRTVLREALAATLVKDERDRPTFDALFEVAFPLVGAAADTGRPRRRGAPGGAGVPGRGRGDGARPERPTSPPDDAARGVVARDQPGRASPVPRAGDAMRARRARLRALLALPFREFTGRDVVEARELAQELGMRLRGRLARRQRRARRGRLDLRRTLRAATASGGVPLRLLHRRRRPGRPGLLALCDLSGSAAAASELLLALLAPAAEHFRRTELFAYVDRLCPISIEDGHVAPEGRLDLHARSDFGRVLEELVRLDAGRLGRGTLVLVLGDARNNRRPPRADLLRALRDRVQRVVWLVPEPAARWDTGDSVLRAYAPACDAVLECTNLHALLQAVRRTL